MRHQSFPKGGQVALLVTFSLFCVLLIFGGGASRNDALSQPLIWLASIGLGLVVALREGPLVLPQLRWPFAFFLCMAALAAIQLVPLPPALWTNLPGRMLYAEGASVLGVSQPWRPLNLTPDLGWSSLLSMLPALAFLMGYSAVSQRPRRMVLPTLLIAAIISGLLGLAQTTGGSGGALRYYAITNADAAVGIFANRNHNALLLVLALPMLAVWARTVQVDRRYDQAPRWVAIGLAIVLLPLILLTGSRAGLLLLLIALPGAFLLTRGERSSSSNERVHERFAKLAKWLPPVLLTLVVLAAVIIARSTALDRLTAATFAEEQRSRMFGTLVQMAQDFFPFGSGFGSFDSVYRGYEQVELLNTSYMNQAHNDFLQLLIEGGLPGALALGAVILWGVRKAIEHWRAAGRLTTVTLLGRLASVMFALILLASLVDYPLRTPLMSVILVVCLIWLAGDESRLSGKSA